MALPERSPLDRAMWEAELIADAWERIDDLDAAHLRSKPNVAEWCASSSTRDEGLVELLEVARRDIREWGVEPRGVIPCGVGSLAVAVMTRTGLAVAKWMPETGSALRTAALIRGLHTASLGPALLDESMFGVLMEKVDPGTPLRSLAPDLRHVDAVARMLNAVRGLAVPGGVELGRPLQEMAFEEFEDLETELDGFSRRAQRTAADAVEVTSGLPLGLGHGDVQLGNVLLGPDGVLKLIDAGGTYDSGYDDAARLAVHATVDALGAGVPWSAEDVIRRVAKAAGLDADTLRVVALAKAANTARYIKRCVPAREWEWRAADEVFLALERL